MINGGGLYYGRSRGYTVGGQRSTVGQSLKLLGQISHCIGHLLVELLLLTEIRTNELFEVFRLQRKISKIKLQNMDQTTKIKDQTTNLLRIEMVDLGQDDVARVVHALLHLDGIDDERSKIRLHREIKDQSHLNCLCLSDLSLDDGILRVAPLGDRLLKR